MVGEDVGEQVESKNLSSVRHRRDYKRWRCSRRENVADSSRGRKSMERKKLGEDGKREEVGSRGMKRNKLPRWKRDDE